MTNTFKIKFAVVKNIEEAKKAISEGKPAISSEKDSITFYYYDNNNQLKNTPKEEIGTHKFVKNINEQINEQINEHNKEIEIDFEQESSKHMFKKFFVKDFAYFTEKTKERDKELLDLLNGLSVRIDKIGKCVAYLLPEGGVEVDETNNENNKSQFHPSFEKELEKKLTRDNRDNFVFVKVGESPNEQFYIIHKYNPQKTTVIEVTDLVKEASLQLIDDYFNGCHSIAANKKVQINKSSSPSFTRIDKTSENFREKGNAYDELQNVFVLLLNYAEICDTIKNKLPKSKQEFIGQKYEEYSNKITQITSTYNHKEWIEFKTWDEMDVAAQWKLYRTLASEYYYRPQNSWFNPTKFSNEKEKKENEQNFLVLKDMYKRLKPRPLNLFFSDTFKNLSPIKDSTSNNCD